MSLNETQTSRRIDLARQTTIPLRDQLRELDSSDVGEPVELGARVMAIFTAFVKEHKDRLPETIPAGPAMVLHRDECALAYRGQRMIPNQGLMFRQWASLRGILATSVEHQLQF